MCKSAHSDLFAFITIMQRLVQNQKKELRPDELLLCAFSIASFFTFHFSIIEPYHDWNKEMCAILCLYYFKHIFSINLPIPSNQKILQALITGQNNNNVYEKHHPMFELLLEEALYYYELCSQPPVQVFAAESLEELSNVLKDPSIKMTDEEKQSVQNQWMQLQEGMQTEMYVEDKNETLIIRRLIDSSCLSSI